MSLKRGNSGLVATVVALALLCASLLGGQTLTVHHDDHDHGHDDHAHAATADATSVIHHEGGGHTHVFSVNSDGTRLERTSQLSQVAKPHLKQVALAFPPSFSRKVASLSAAIQGRSQSSYWTSGPPLRGTVGLRI
jgi:hypothetical protein